MVTFPLILMLRKIWENALLAAPDGLLEMYLPPDTRKLVVPLCAASTVKVLDIRLFYYYTRKKETNNCNLKSYQIRLQRSKVEFKHKRQLK